jgi:hypothetical protein
MRNETLKNLLLTASLISVSALLTACGDTEPTSPPAKPSSQPEQRVKDALETLKTEEAQADNAKNKAIEAIDQAQTEIFAQVDAKASQLDEMLTAFDVSVPADPRISKDAMKKARTALSDHDKSTLDTLKKSIDDLSKSFDYKDLPRIIPVNHADSVAVAAKLKAELSKVQTKNSKEINNITAATQKYMNDRASLNDAYYAEFLKYTSATATPSATSDAAIQTRLLTLRAAMRVEEMAIRDAIDNALMNLDIKRRDYNIFRTTFSDRLSDLNDQIAYNNDYLATPTAMSNVLKTILRGGFALGGTLGTTAGFDDAFTAYFTEVKPKLMACSLTANDLALDIATKLSKNILVAQTDSSGQKIRTLDEWMNGGFVNQAAGQRIQNLVKQELINLINFGDLQCFIKDTAIVLPAEYTPAAAPAALSAGAIKDLSSNVSLRQARTAATGLVDASAFNMNGVAGQSIELGMPLFVQLKGDVSSAKATEAATGSVAYRLGNTVIGAIQGYANSGAGFGIDSRQLETSVVASHSFGAFFVEGQVGTVSATEVHNNDWSGYRSQVTLGLDTEFVSPFVQLAHRQLDRSGLDLNETTAYVGLDAEVAKLAADTYSIDTRLLAKAGYGSKAWSLGSNDLGSTTGFSGSVEWSSSLNLNSGVTFSSNLALDTLAGSSAAVNVSLDR